MCGYVYDRFSHLWRKNSHLNCTGNYLWYQFAVSFASFKMCDISDGVTLHDFFRLGYILIDTGYLLEKESELKYVGPTTTTWH